MTETKTIRLDAILKDLRPFVIAFSGGVDSSFLLHRAVAATRSGAMAVTVRTPYMAAREIDEATAFALSRGIDHKIIDMEIPAVINNNPRERCYLCKKLLFARISDFAAEKGFRNVVDGTNAGDSGESRPGIRALRELGIRSPLAESGLTKNEIRDLLLKDGIPLWNKPSLSCLLTRIPYNTEVSDGMLRMIEKAEDFLFEKGYPGTRVRLHGEVARIECLPGYLTQIINDPEKEQIVAKLKKIGFRYVSLDLEGYRTGSMD